MSLNRNSVFVLVMTDGQDSAEEKSKDMEEDSGDEPSL